MFAEVGPIMMDTDILGSAQAVIQSEERVLPCVITSGKHSFFSEYSSPSKEDSPEKPPRDNQRRDPPLSAEAVISDNLCFLRALDSKEELLCIPLEENFPSLRMHKNVNNKLDMHTDEQQYLTLSFQNNVQRDVFALVIRYFCGRVLDHEAKKRDSSLSESAASEAEVETAPERNSETEFELRLDGSQDKRMSIASLPGDA